MITQKIEVKNKNLIIALFSILAFLPLFFVGTNKADAAAGIVYDDEMRAESRIVEFQPNTKLFMWTGKQGINGRALMAPLRSDNFFYPKEGTSKMKVKFLATNKVGAYQIQLPGNYFYVDDSKPFSRYPDSCYAPVQKYYLLGQRPKYSNLRASWEIIEVPGTKDKSYRLRNVATGRYMSVHIWDSSQIGSPLRLILKEPTQQEINFTQTFQFTKR